MAQNTWNVSLPGRIHCNTPTSARYRMAIVAFAFSVSPHSPVSRHVLGSIPARLRKVNSRSIPEEDIYLQTAASYLSTGSFGKISKLDSKTPTRQNINFRGGPNQSIEVGQTGVSNSFAKQAAFQAAGGVAGHFIGAGIDAALAARAASAQAEAIQFGKTANQVYHTFRHLQEAGVNVEAAKDAILSDIGTKGALPQGLTTGTVNVGGRSLTYNAFKLADGTINVGRVTVK